MHIFILLDINWCQREKTEIWRKFQQAEEKNLPFEPEGPQGQRAQMANFSLRLDGIFWILRFFPRTPVDILYISRINSIASRQFGAVSRQYGAVRGQYGAVRGLFSEFSIFFLFLFFQCSIFYCSLLHIACWLPLISIFSPAQIFFRLHIFFRW